MTRTPPRLNALPRRVFAVAIATFSALLPASARAQHDSTPSLPASAIGHFATRWLDALAADDSAAIDSLVRHRFAPAALGGRGAGAIVARERWRARNLGPARLVRVDEATDTSLSALVFHPAVDGWGHLRLRTDADGRVASIALSRMEEPPPGLGARGKLDDARIAAELDRFVARLVRDGRFSGTVGIAHGGRTLLARAYGDADRATHRPVTPATRFQLASVGKLFTTAVVARLVQEGRLSYADTLGRWIPEYPNARARRSVTLRHLLTHSSGIADYFLRPSWEALPAAEREQLSLEDHLRFFAADSLEFEPGTRTQYRNSNFLLLGLIAQRAGGQPFARLADRLVFAPAGMTSTWRDAPPDRRARGYTFFGPMRTLRLAPEPSLVVDEEPAHGSPAGGGLSTLGDMLRFAGALHGGTLLSRAEFDTLVARHGIDETPASWAGYGFDAVERWRGATIATKSGSSYGVHTQVDVYPDLGYDVVVLSNLESWGAEAVLYKARELVTRR